MSRSSLFPQANLGVTVSSKSSMMSTTSCSSGANSSKAWLTYSQNCLTSKHSTTAHTGIPNCVNVPPGTSIRPSDDTSWQSPLSATTASLGATAKSPLSVSQTKLAPSHFLPSALQSVSTSFMSTSRERSSPSQACSSSIITAGLCGSTAIASIKLDPTVNDLVLPTRH